MPAWSVSTAPPRDEAGDDPAAGVAVQHGDLLGHADGVVDGDDVAEDGNLGLPGHLGDDGGVEVDRRLSAPVGGVVLVGHDAVEPHLVGQGVLVVVLVVQDVGLVRVEERVGKSQPSRIELLQLGLVDISLGLL